MLEELIHYFENFINPNRLQLIDCNLQKRTKYITIVLEDIFQPHNSAAILRTCDCFGIQDVHIVENRNKFKPSEEIAVGSDQWLNIYRYNGKTENTANAIKTLKSNNYRIVATSSHGKGIPIEKFNIYDGKAAFVFGTELTGITEEVEKLADEFVYIPMAGFTESFNISVAAAIILHEVSNKLKQSSIQWNLDKEESDIIKLQWLKNSIKKPDLIEKYFFSNIYKKPENERSGMLTE
jgi:tRNA (guanosine-2'-O-)-methyltransferase